MSERSISLAGKHSSIADADRLPASKAGTAGYHEALDLAKYAAAQGAYADVVMTYGADPTGVADSLTAFTNAYASGKPVIVPAGTYKVSNYVEPPSGSRLIGLGKPTIRPTTASRVFRFASKTNVEVSGIAIDCSGLSLTGTDCIFANGLTNSKFENIDFISTIGAVFVTGVSSRVFVRDCTISNCTSTAIEFNSATCRDCIAEDNLIDDAVGFGVRVSGGSGGHLIKGNECPRNGIELVGIVDGCNDCIVVDNEALWTGDNGISVSGNNHVVSNNRCEFCAFNGITLYGDNNAVSGNVCNDNGQASITVGHPQFGLAYAGIAFAPSFGGLASHNGGAGNVCLDRQVTKSQSYGTRYTAAGYSAWTTGVVVAIDAIRYNGSNIYRAANGGTTGATAPTHTSGTVTDGAVSWVFSGTFTVFGADNNTLSGQTSYGNSVAATYDTSGGSNCEVGVYHGYGAWKNATPVGSRSGYGGDTVQRRGAVQPWTMLYGNSGGATYNNSSWYTFQPRVSGTAASKPSLGNGYEGSVYHEFDKTRLVAASGAAGTWHDSLGRLADHASGSTYALTATGTNQAGALALPYAHCALSTVASGAGAKLPALLAGQEMAVYNGGANALLIYPATGGTINGGAANAAVSLAVGKVAWFMCLVADTIIAQI